MDEKEAEARPVMGTIFLVSIEIGVFKISRNVLAPPVMGTIFLVYVVGMLYVCRSLALPTLSHF